MSEYGKIVKINVPHGEEAFLQWYRVEHGAKRLGGSRGLKGLIESLLAEKVAALIEETGFKVAG